MKIIGLLRVRNEAIIIHETLNHMAGFCDEIYVYDDCSTDDTAKICSKHFAVKGFAPNTTPWSKDRKMAEWQNRSILLNHAKKYASEDDWFVYMDADERIEFDWLALKSMPKCVIGIRMKLFDFYITPEDVDSYYCDLKMLGPEYRNILMVFRNLPSLDYSSPDQREVHLRSKGLVADVGYVKHYGKSISIEQWEETCEYYTKHFPKYSAKWKARMGKAIHTTSSFGKDLITWDEKETKGILLTREMEKNNIYEHTCR
jgi:glycosyltransferase involved in cell wall biosynthesis